jgi:hypothetical protein
VKLEPKRPKARGLEPGQREDLMKHLKNHLQLSEIRPLMDAIEEQLLLVGRREVHLDDDRRDMARVARAAKALRAALDHARPPMGPDPNYETFGWAEFGATLADLERSATFMAKMPAARRRGRQRQQKWRDELITVVWHAYPAKHRKKTEEGDFEITIGLLLRFLGARHRNVHAAVISALTRR